MIILKKGFGVMFGINEIVFNLCYFKFEEIDDMIGLWVLNFVDVVLIGNMIVLIGYLNVLIDLIYYEKID